MQWWKTIQGKLASAHCQRAYGNPTRSRPAPRLFRCRSFEGVRSGRRIPDLRSARNTDSLFFLDIQGTSKNYRFFAHKFFPVETVSTVRLPQTRRDAMFKACSTFSKIDSNGDSLVILKQVVNWELFRPELSKVREKKRLSNAGRKP